jgi:hypothetical protein
MAFSENRPYCVRTNDKGEYDLKDLQAGKYRLVVSADGRGMAVGNGGQAIEVRTDGSVSKKHGDTKSPPKGAVVSGLVRDALGGLVPNAQVRVSSLTAPGATGIDVGVEVQADIDGQFRADVPEGRVRLVAFAEGYATADVSRIAPAEGVELVLAPASTIQGRVVADGDGRPVAGATVRASTPLGNVQEASSDAEGAFVLTALRPGMYQLRAFARGWVGEPGDAVSLSLSDHATDVLIPMHLGVRVEATLFAGDKPCTSGVVAVGPASPGDVSVPGEVTAPDANGRLIFPALPPGQYSVELNCEGYGTEFAAPLVLGTEDKLGLLWKMSARAELAIHAVDTRGKPINRLQLSVRPLGQNAAQGPDTAPSRAGQTDADGRLTFKGMADGQFVIEGRYVSEPVLIELKAGEIRQAEVVASTLGTIQVKVATPNGAPVPQVTVSADRTDAPGGIGRAIGNGVFEVGPLDPGPYTVSARDSINPRVVQPGPVVVVPGEETKVTVVYGGYDGEISGRILSGPDQPLPDVWVSAVAAEQQGDPYATGQQFIASLEGTRVFSAPDGQFRLTGLAREGHYYVIAERPSGGQAKLDNVQVGQRVELVIEESGQLSGRARTAEGSAVR